MATYNGEKYIREQIDSILRQTYPNMELIIVDDRSSDSTPDILRAYSDKFPNLRVVINETNLGYIKNFEKGILLSKGDYIALSDQDDIWMDNKIEILLKHIGQYDIIYSDSILVNEKGNSLGKKMSDIKNQLVYTDCLMYAVGAWAPGHAQLIKRYIIHQCIPFPSLVTHDFWLGFVASCHNGMGYYSEPLVLYRQHQSNAISANTSRKNNTGQKKNIKEKNALRRARMHLLYSKCPDHLPQKKIYAALNKSYQSFSLANNWHRAKTFFKYRDRILAYKKKNRFMKNLFCIKMFFKIV
jgi:glycosyltransferase involved in cell wall biosynthesis